MQAPGDNIIYQLTNIGASQQPSQQPSQRSPLRTPRTNSAGGTSSRGDSVTPSPSSRGKRWADRLAKFQLHSDKRKTTMSPSSYRTVSTSPVVSQTNSPPSNPHGTRTSSLPRPPDWLENSMKFSPPSKMGAFGHGKALTSSKKSFLNEHCTVCEEPVLNRSSGERIIELECNHISHQECLLVSFENTNGFDLTDFFSIFPPCNKCITDRSIENRCIPKNDELRDRLVSLFLIAGNGRRHSEPNNSPLQLTSSVRIMQQQPLMPPSFPNMQHRSLSSPRVAVSSQALPSPQHSPRTPELDTGGMRLASVPFKARKASAPNFRREWPISHEPSMRDSVVSQARTENYSTSASDKLPLYILRVHFIEILLKSFTTLSDWKIDEEFGLLRLVDHLMVSKDGLHYSGSWCMLFERALVVASLTDDAKTKPDGSLEVTLQDLQVYKPMTNVKVDTVESSVLKWTLQETESLSWQEIYVTETLHTDASQVIQKWISALLDLDLEISAKYFTSTLQLPPIMKNDNRTAHLSASLTGLITPTRVVELTSNKRSSVIIKRVFKLSEEQCATISTAGGTLESAMTNISSILSLKREIPDQLVVVLQLDYDKVKAQESSVVIFNSLKALGMKFPKMSVCVVDSEGFVKTFGAANEKFTTVDEVLSSGTLQNEITFEPAWLKTMLYADDPLRSLGIAIVSNTSMDSQKSCLLKDYSCFTSVGRRRPKELKIKVGYLNLDYSDKVGELVEVESWENFLEALSYSFSLAFGDDEEEEDISVLEDLTDSENDEPSDEVRSVSSVGSTTTILIASPFDGSEGNTRSFLADNENSHFATTSYSTPLGGKAGSTYSQEFVREEISNRNIQDGCDFLLEDIERTIHEIDQVSSPSHTETSTRPSGLYQYI